VIKAFLLTRQSFDTSTGVQQNNIRCLEADVRAAERYLTERFLTGPVSIQLDEPAAVLVNPRITPDDYRPGLKLMSFDIETDYATDDLFSIAFVTKEHRRVLMIGKNGPALDEEGGQDDFFVLQICYGQPQAINASGHHILWQVQHWRHAKKSGKVYIC
jgi:hypothetical protein